MYTKNNLYIFIHSDMNISRIDLKITLPPFNDVMVTFPTSFSSKSTKGTRQTDKQTNITKMTRFRLWNVSDV